MTTEQVVAFLLFAVVAAVTPGPSNVMLTAAGANAGVMRGLPCLLGVSTGMGLMMFVVPLGLGSLVLAHPLVLKALKWCGAAFLLWLAWKIATSTRLESEAERTPVGYVGAAMFQWLNPKSWLVSASASGTFLHAAAGSAVLQSVVLGALFCLAALPSGFAEVPEDCEPSTSPWACSWRSRSCSSSDRQRRDDLVGLGDMPGPASANRSAATARSPSCRRHPLARRPTSISHHGDRVDGEEEPARQADDRRGTNRRRGREVFGIELVELRERRTISDEARRLHHAVKRAPGVLERGAEIGERLPRLCFERVSRRGAGAWVDSGLTRHEEQAPDTHHLGVGADLGYARSVDDSGSWRHPSSHPWSDADAAYPGTVDCRLHQTVCLDVLDERARIDRCFRGAALGHRHGLFLTAMSAFEPA